MKKLIKIFLAIIFYANLSMAQLEKKEFVVFTVEQSFKISQHDKKVYNFIVAVDSLVNYNYEIAPLYLEGFSYNNLSDCCSGNPVNPNLVFKNTTYDFKISYLNQLEEFEQLLNKKKKMIQTIKRKWNSGQKEIIKIYYTPVLGEFCSCGFLDETSTVKKVFIPFSNVEFNLDILNNNKKYILNRDYSCLDYSAFSY